MDKQVWNSVFNRLKGGDFSVQYWDGEEVNYGIAKPTFKCVFKHKPSLVSLAADPMLTIGDGYVAGWIDFDGDLNSMFRLVHRNAVPCSSLGGKALSAVRHGLGAFQQRNRQKQNIAEHYDLGNDFFRLWLDETMSYSCAYFERDDEDLKDAQLGKIDLVLRKMRLRPGQKLLDIGCSWGWLIKRAVEKFGVTSLGITLSEEQHAGAGKRLSEAGLADKAQVRLMNYLDLAEEPESFDAVVSIGMFEHVGRDFFRDYLGKVNSLLKPGGKSMLHTLTSPTETETNSWIKKHIFPGGYIPSLREVIALLPEFNFQVLQVESLRRHYVKTLECWHENFMKPEVKAKVTAMFDEAFIRMWSLYLLGAAASLRVGSLDVHQIVFTKGANNDLPMTWNDVYSH